ncbi:haloacid dehalogenase [Pantoea sp. Acro-805]|uniref:Haloacid dehalogenase n=1 Tax=Candidatus Pantoea formicae TaxID=2608355 RepID=A0ABX0R6F7_9GAMM|nr:haloacid dehalogenase [Pantoea formicae]NIF03608.1 haloacid dehalogenase [Pantoea formicae]
MHALIETLGNEQEIYKLEFLAESSQVISFDFFDTLYTRPLDDPEDAFDLIGYKFDFPNFRQLRRKAQTEAFKEMIKNGRKEITLDNIYDNFVEAGELRTVLQQAEIDIELSLVEPNPPMLAFFNEMINQGKHVVITSDMYFGENFFKDALDKFNVKQVPLYISADQNSTKRDFGEIFLKIISDFKVEPQNILHIGDNQTADVIRPSEKGLSTWHYNPVHLQNKSKDHSLIHSIANGLYRSRFDDRIAIGTFSELGYKYQAPATWGFLKWIQQQCIHDRVTKLLFISRDGFSLEKLASKYLKKELPDFHYFLGSRIAFSLAVITEENFMNHIPFLLSGSDGLSPGELLERIGVEPPSEEVMNGLGIPCDTIISHSNVELVRKFIVGYRTEILKVCQQTRRGLFMYLTGMGIKPGDVLAMVDVGWSGTTQEAFVNAVSTFMDVEVIGYYFCLANTPERQRRDATLNMKALISNQSAGQYTVDKIYENRIVAELFFSAPHATIIGYLPNKSHVIPIEDEGRAKAANHDNIIRSLNEGMNDFVNDFLAFKERIGIKFFPMQLAQSLVDLVAKEEWRNQPLFHEVENFDSWASSRNQTIKFTDYSKS